MRKKIVVFSFIMVFLNSAAAVSQEMNTGKAALSEFIQAALNENPQIKATDKEWQAALQRIPQVKSLPDPMLSFSHFGQSVETRLGPQRNKISVSQMFPFFGKLSIKGEVAHSQAWILEAQYRAVKADIILKVKQTFFSLYWFDKALKISQEEKEVLQRLVRVAQKKYETGQATQQDVLKAQLEISKVLDKILSLKQGRKAVAAEMNALLNRPVEASVWIVDEVEVPGIQFELVELYEWAKENRPELIKVQRLIEKGEKSLKLTKKNYYPDFHVMFDYIDIGSGTTTSPEDGRNAWMGSVGINIPLWRKRLRAAEAEEATKLEASEDLYRNIENETLSRVNELFFEAKTVEEQIKLYRYSLLPQAEQSFKASEIGYLAGKVDFLNLLESERMILMIKTGYHKAVSDLNKSLARLERIVGKELVNREMIERGQNKVKLSSENSDNLIEDETFNNINLKNEEQGGKRK
jgi:cobalt-zinc-cadmium efflux system outer membrane protein